MVPDPLPVPCLRRAFAIVLSVVALVAGPSAWATDAPRAPIVVRVNNLTRDDWPVAHGMGLIPDLIVNAEQRREYGQIAGRYEVVRKALPDVDFPAMIGSVLHCLPSPEAKEDCREMAVYQGASLGPDAAAATAGGIRTNVAIVIGHRHPYNALTIYFTFSETAPVVVGEARKRFVFQYIEPVSGENDGYPFADPSAGNLSASEAAARTYWFDGHPSRFETTFRNALEEFREFTTTYYDRAGAPELDPTTTAWWNDLGRLGDLKEKGLVKCLWNACRTRYFRVQGGRIWTATVAGQSSQLYESDPLSSFGGKP